MHLEMTPIWDKVFPKKGENKEFVKVEGATHCDLYDNYDFVPFNKMQKFFEKNLKA